MTGTGFLTELERSHLEGDVVAALTEKIRRLYELEFADFADEDLPVELSALMRALERDLWMDFKEDES